ncbi:MAG: hypothetical protein EKK53_02445 [Burkholderiales bacterium]|nr:MAG: hypothetical protein EKK53_02445 [Burkholderiales bacterium]
MAEPLAEIRGLEALQEENDLRALLVLDLEANLGVIERLDFDTLPPREVARWSKWVNTVEATFDRAEAAIAAGRVLLTSDNLSPFKETLKDRADEPRFQSYLKTLNAVTA